MLKVRILLWPYASVAVALLLLALVAPRVWQPEPSQQPHFSIPHIQAEPLAAAVPLCADGSEASACPALPPPMPAEVPAPLAEASTLEKELVTADFGDDGRLPRVATLPPEAELSVLPPSELAERYAGEPEGPAAPPAIDPQSLPIEPPVAEQFRDVPQVPALARLPAMAPAPALRGPTVAGQSPGEKRSALILGHDAAWPVPASLVAQLEPLRGAAIAPDWADEVLDLLTRLAETGRLGSPDSVTLLRALRDKAERIEAIEPHSLAGNMAAYTSLMHFRRAAYALRRRVELWEQTHRLLALSDMPEPPAGDAAATRVNASATSSTTSARDLRPILRQLEPLLGSAKSRAKWQSHLRWSELSELSGPDRANDREARGELARDVLKRLDASRSGAAQAEFLKRAPWPGLEAELRRWAAGEPTDYAELLADLEQFETTSSAADARKIAAAMQHLAYQPGDEAAEVLRLLEAHYRNANLRVAISGDFLNRLLPDVHPVREAVDDEILGARVQGDTLTHTKLFVRLMPDRRRVRLGLEARGVVSSETESTRGPARIYSAGDSVYSARKELTADRHGLRVYQTEATARAGQQSTDIGTSFDSIPLFNSIARAIAQRQYDAVEGDARREVEWRIAARARERLDAEVHRQLSKAEADFNEKVLGPMERLGLKPTAIEMQTTTDRIVSRMRLADDHQLAAFTPRCQAPGDSLLSVQMHESALNNALEQLKLHGREMGVKQLFTEITAALGLRNLPLPEDLPDDVEITFADEQPLRLTFADGQVTIEVRVAKLVRGDTCWKDFVVRSHWKPQAAGRLDTVLVRDGVVELAGKRLNFASQVSLRAIFGKVFSKNHAVQLLPDQIVRDPRLADLRMTQLEMVDGWISVALSIDREIVARQRAAAKR